MGELCSISHKELIIYFHFCSNSENQCWKKISTLPTYEDFQFLIVDKLYSESEDELAANIENIVKTKGFQDDETFLTTTNISLECLGSDNWKIIDDLSE